MSAKFKVGDMARIGGYRQLPYPDKEWLRVGRLMRVVRVQPRGRGRHTVYWFHPRRGRPAVFLDSRQLRHPSERFRAPRCPDTLLRSKNGL